LHQDDDAQSKGFGFVEFKEHDDALKALHRVNNNASYFGPQQRPIVEFAVDDARKLNLRRQSQKQQLAQVAKKPRWKKKDAEGLCRKYFCLVFFVIYIVHRERC
jgi:nucleolar protein 4